MAFVDFEIGAQQIQTAFFSEFDTWPMTVQF